MYLITTLLPAGIPTWETQVNIPIENVILLSSHLSSIFLHNTVFGPLSWIKNGVCLSFNLLCLKPEWNNLLVIRPLYLISNPRF